MRNLIGSRDLFEFEGATSVGSILAPRSSTPFGQAGERTGAHSGVDTAGLVSRRTLEALKEAVSWSTPTDGPFAETKEQLG